MRGKYIQCTTILLYSVKFDYELGITVLSAVILPSPRPIVNSITQTVLLYLCTTRNTDCSYRASSVNTRYSNTTQHYNRYLNTFSTHIPTYDTRGGESN